MFKKAYTRLEFSENLRGKIRRCFDGGLSGFQRISYRKLFLIIFCFAILLLYVAPGIARWLFGSSNVAPQDQLSRCIDDRLTPFYLDNFEFNAHIRSNPSYLPEDLSMLPYVGNGIFSLEISDDAHLNIREGRGN